MLFSTREALRQKDLASIFDTTPQILAPRKKMYQND
jgi:hypothetical protein